jgi:O-antigen/teichoic acid export membrane protein
MMQRVIGDSLAYGTATILSRATLMVALLVLPFILSPREYGALSMIVTVAALVAILAPLEIAQGLARFYATAESSAKKAWAGTAWTFLVVMSAAFLTLGQLLAEPLATLIFGDAGYLTVFRIALLFMTVNCVFLFLQNQFRWEFRAAEYVLISLVFSFLTLALSIGLGLLFDRPLLGVVLGQTLGAIIAVALGVFGLRRSFLLGVDLAKLREMLRFSLPLVPAGVALFLSVYASRLILNGLASLEDVGLYTLAAQIAGIATLGIVGVQGALTPHIMAHHHDPATPGHLARLFEVFVGYAVVASLALGLLAPEFIQYLSNPAYAAAGPLVLLLAPAALLSQMYVFAPGFAVAKRTMTQMWVSMASALSAVAANLVFIQLWGTMGAAIATLIAATVFLGLWFALSQRLYPLPVRWGRVTLAILCGASLGWAGQSVRYEGVLTALLAKGAIVTAAAVLVIVIGLVPLRAVLAMLKRIAASRRSQPASRRG